MAQERTELGARAIGMGGAFVSVSDDANGLYWNPAGISTLNRHELNFDLARLHWGIENELLAHGGIGYIHSLKKLGAFGIRTKYFSSNIFRQMILSFSYSNRLIGAGERGLFFGVSGGIIRDSYNKKAFNIDQPDDPLLRNIKLDKTVPIFDAGLIMKFKKYSIGISVKNINQPDVSVGAEEDKLPFLVFSGFSYKFRDNLLSALSFEFERETSEKKTRLFYSLGTEYWYLKNILGFRGGLRAGEITKGGFPQELTLGATLRRGNRLRLDYAFLYPLGSLAGTGASTHRLSLILEFQLPKERFVDFFTDNNMIAPQFGTISAGDDDTIHAWVKNIGDKEGENFYVTLFERGPSGEWKMVDSPLRIRRSLAPQESLLVSFPVKPDIAGEYEYIFRVNDNGKSFPELNPLKKERSLENNIASTKLNVLSLPKGKISVEPSKLTIGRTLELKEEEPIVPVFFFERGSAAISARYIKTIERIGKRLESNPDIIVELRGYYNLLDDSLDKYKGTELAFERAKAVYDEFVARAPSLKDRVRIRTDDYLPSAIRTGTIIGAEIKKDEPLVNE
ncbi:MAG: type IX secretion system membrane protein PorP/SprF, partial [bacterium]